MHSATFLAPTQNSNGIIVTFKYYTETLSISFQGFHKIQERKKKNQWPKCICPTNVGCKTGVLKHFMNDS